MPTQPKVLVTSAGGKTGLQTALQLREKDFPVRAFVRRHDRRSVTLERAGAEVFVGDQYSLVDMRAAMQGVQRAYQCAPMPRDIHLNPTTLTCVSTQSRWWGGVRARNHP